MFTCRILHQHRLHRDVHTWLGRQDYSSLRASPLPGRRRSATTFSRAITLESNLEVLIRPYSPLRDVHTWLGRQDYSSLRASPLRGRRRSAATFSRAITLESNLEVLILPYSPLRDVHTWLGRQDSNLRIRGSKPRALPLGDVPINLLVTHPRGTVNRSFHCGQQGRTIDTPRHKA
jgi:hypothetical protein